MIEGKFKRSYSKWIYAIIVTALGTFAAVRVISFGIEGLQKKEIFGAVTCFFIALVAILIAAFSIAVALVNHKAYFRIEGRKLDARFALKAELHIKLEEIQSIRELNGLLFLTVNGKEYQIQGMINAKEIFHYIVEQLNLKPEPDSNDELFDKAEWQYESAMLEYCKEKGLAPDEIADDDNFDDRIIWEMASNHILHFYTWLILNNLLSDRHYENENELKEIDLIKQRKKTGFDFLEEYCDLCITEDDVSEKVLPFVKDYYSDYYLEDYSKSIKQNNYSVFSWEDYETIAASIDKQYNLWCHNESEQLVGLAYSYDKTEEDLCDYLANNFSIEKSDVKTATCRVCNNRSFYVSLDDTEGAAMIQCERCKTERLILDSKDIWNECKYNKVFCPRCRNEAFNLKAGFVRRENGDAKWVYVGIRCCNCGSIGCIADWKLSVSPTTDIENNI